MASFNALREMQTEPWRRFLIGESSAMLQICDVIQLIAAKRCTVLITGETGTGKEVIAKAIHAASNRSALPMVPVNCTALPANLIETELFGHAKGAFTGAHMSRMGRFEQANRSTIFLDEIGDLPLDAQAKLLRVLQEQEFQRVGSTETVRVDVRVVAATNVDLEQAVKERRFREDLYYRLNVVPIQMPPLRERKEDIPLLLEHFLNKIRLAENAAPKQISPEAIEFLMNQDWPGNVRQLEHSVQMAFALSGERQTLTVDDFAVPGKRPSAAPQPIAVANRPLVTVPNDGLDFDDVVSSFELSLLNQALAISGGNKARAADLLRIKRTTLLAKMKTFEDRAAQLKAASSEKMAAPAASVPVSRGAALITESESALREMMARALESDGYRVLPASGHASALELLQCWKSQISLVVTADENLVEQVRGAAAGMPVIVASSSPRSQMLSARFPRTAVLACPFSPADLIAAAKQLSADRFELASVCA